MGAIFIWMWYSLAKYFFHCPTHEHPYSESVSDNACHAEAAIYMSIYAPAKH